jgi:nucleotide-binding universal stress UspA family protein
MAHETSPTSKKQHIVVGFDFSELAERALQEALVIASRRPSPVLHVVVVGLQAANMLLMPDNSEPVTKAGARENVRLRVTELIEEFHSAHGPSRITELSVYVLTGLSAGDTGHLIAEVAKDVDAEVILVGSHGRRGLARMLLGSVAERVVREARTSVYVVRPSDFVDGTKVPAIEPPLAPGQAHLKEFAHGRTYHYVDKSEQYTSRTMPVT